jgi:hypothetical protein
MTYSVVMCGDVRCLFLKPNYKMTENFPSGINKLELANFVGFSDKHSSLVANVRHLSTNFISPHFHVVFDDPFKTVNKIGVNEPVIESICQDLFQFNRELYAKEELDKAGNIIYQPPPLHEVCLDEAGQQQGNKDCIRQHCRNNDLMRDRNHAVQQAIPTTVTTVKNADDNPEMLPISDDDSVDSSLYIRNGFMPHIMGYKFITYLCP